MSKNVEQHVETINIHEVVITPEHAQRTESAEFRRTKDRLRADGHYRCWVCDAAENIQIHHYGSEWSLELVTDLKKLKTFCEEWDVYGYGKLLKNKPIESVDDIRNAMALCAEHHIGIDDEAGTPTGIHNMSFPVWIIQKLAKKGLIPVPQEGQTVEEVMQDIKEHTEE